MITRGTKVHICKAYYSMDLVHIVMVCCLDVEEQNCARKFSKINWSKFKRCFSKNVLILQAQKWEWVFEVFMGITINAGTAFQRKSLCIMSCVG